jgi:hypothetical protein
VLDADADADADVDADVDVDVDAMSMPIPINRSADGPMGRSADAELTARRAKAGGAGLEPARDRINSPVPYQLGDPPTRNAEWRMLNAESPENKKARQLSGGLLILSDCCC